MCLRHNRTCDAARLDRARLCITFLQEVNKSFPGDDIYLHVKMQEHRAIIEFLEKRIAQLEDSSLEVAEEIRHFSDDMRNHFSEEEEIVFPLALKANSSS